MGVREGKGLTLSSLKLGQDWWRTSKGRVGPSLQAVRRGSDAAPEGERRRVRPGVLSLSKS